MQILTQEDWNIVLFLGMQRTSHWAALYFVALMTFGNYVLFNLLVAILVEGFSNQVRQGGIKGSTSSLYIYFSPLILYKSAFYTKWKNLVNLKKEKRVWNSCWIFSTLIIILSIINQCSFDSLHYCCLHSVFSVLKLSFKISGVDTRCVHSRKKIVKKAKNLYFVDNEVCVW